jgi:hypothetical protein
VKDIGDKKVERFRRYRNGPLSKWSALSKEKKLECCRYRNAMPSQKGKSLKVTAVEMQCLLEMKRLKAKATAIEMEHPLQKKKA